MSANAQEKFWAGDFGNEYTKRNRVEWRKRVPFWTNVLGISQARSVLDVGCNAGWNMLAIKAVDHEVRTVGIDVNADAVAESRSGELDARIASLYQAGGMFHGQFDLVCTTGVLIHVPPHDLKDAMASIVAASKRYVLAVEYESHEEEEVLYRGNAERLWKRPFGMLYQEMGLKLLVESPAHGFDQCRAWLLRK